MDTMDYEFSMNQEKVSDFVNDLHARRCAAAKNSSQPATCSRAVGVGVNDAELREREKEIRECKIKINALQSFPSALW